MLHTNMSILPYKTNDYLVSLLELQLRGDAHSRIMRLENVLDEYDHENRFLNSQIKSLLYENELLRKKLVLDFGSNRKTNEGSRKQTAMSTIKKIDKSVACNQEIQTRRESSKKIIHEKKEQNTKRQYVAKQEFSIKIQSKKQETPKFITDPDLHPTQSPIHQIYTRTTSSPILKQPSANPHKITTKYKILPESQLTPDRIFVVPTFTYNVVRNVKTENSNNGTPNKTYRMMTNRPYINPELQARKPSMFEQRNCRKRFLSLTKK